MGVVLPLRLVLLVTMTLALAGCTTRSSTLTQAGPVTYLFGMVYGGPSVMMGFNPTDGRLGRTVVGGVFAPGGRAALEVDTNGDRVFPADLTDGHVGAAIRVGYAPTAVAFSANGLMAYVADSGAAAYADQPTGPAADRPSNEVTPIDLQDDRPGPPIKVCQGPTALALAASTHVLVVGCERQVALVDTTTERVERVLDLGYRDIIAISPSGTEAAVANMPPLSGGQSATASSFSGAQAVSGDSAVADAPIPFGDIVPIDLRAATAGAPISIGSGGGSLDVAFAPGNNRYLYVTTYRIDQTSGIQYQVVLRVDLLTRRVSAPLTLGGDVVSNLYFWPNGETAYVAPMSSHGETNRYRVALSLHADGHVVQFNGYTMFDAAAQAPYLCAFYSPRHQFTVVNAATGTTRVVHLSFLPEDVVTG